MTPPAATATNAERSRGRSQSAKVASAMDPAIAARVPTTVTAPEAPGCRGLSVRIDLGVRPKRMPISLAQVSAVAAAKAPAKANGAQKKSEVAAAARAGMAPLAMTCRAPRLDRSASPGKAESALELTKKKTSTSAKGVPPKPKMIEPMRVAAMAPEKVSARAFQASPATAAAAEMTAAQ